jgi:hypothetical protein
VETSGKNLIRLTKVAEHRPWATTRWLRNRVYGGTLPHYRIGGLVFIDLDELDELVLNSRIDPTL